MATLTKQQLALLKLQLQNDPEFKTGLYESEPVYHYTQVQDYMNLNLCIMIFLLNSCSKE